MDPIGEEQLDYGDDECAGSQKSQFHDGGAVSVIEEDEMMGEDDEYDDLYSDVNVGQGFMPHFRKVKSSDHKIEVSSVSVLKSGGSPSLAFSAVGVEVKEMKTGYLEQTMDGILFDKHPEDVAQKHPHITASPGKNMLVLRAPSAPMPPKVDVHPQISSGVSMVPLGSGLSYNRNGPTILLKQNGLNENQATINETSKQPSGSIENNGPTMLFVGELHWWTTDAELESVLTQYGRVKEVKFFDERASGKSKGYCQVEFYDSVAAAACKEGMNGHVFNGRACVVAFASPQTLKQMGQSYINKNQGQSQGQSQGRRQTNDGGCRGGGVNFHGGDGGRNGGKAGWGQGGQGFPNRGQGGSGGAMRGRGPFGVKGIFGAGGSIGAQLSGVPYGQNLGGAVIGGPASNGLMHPHNMMATGFDPTYMSHGSAFGAFSALAFPGMMPSFPGVNSLGLPGVAPHVNPAFFVRGMTTIGMGLLGSSGMDANSHGTWNDTNMSGWRGEEHGRKNGESTSGGDGVASEYGYKEGHHDRGSRANPSREKDRGPEHEWSGNSQKKYHDDREQDWVRSNKDHYREENNGYVDCRQRDCSYGNEDDRERGQSSMRSRSKSYVMQHNNDTSRSRDADYGKKRRVPE